jgi:hypothetical protein
MYMLNNQLELSADINECSPRRRVGHQGWGRPDPASSRRPQGSRPPDPSSSRGIRPPPGWREGRKGTGLWPQRATVWGPPGGGDAGSCIAPWSGSGGHRDEPGTPPGLYARWILRRAWGGGHHRVSLRRGVGAGERGRERIEDHVWFEDQWMVASLYDE